MRHIGLLGRAAVEDEAVADEGASGIDAGGAEADRDADAPATAP